MRALSFGLDAQTGWQVGYTKETNVDISWLWMCREKNGKEKVHFVTTVSTNNSHLLI